MKILFSEKIIKEKVLELANKILEDYKDNNSILLLSILKGSFIFTADLCRYLSLNNLNVQVEFLKVKSYSGTNSTGNLIFENNIPQISGKNVLIIEDIFDTGLTLMKIYEKLEKLNPKKLEIASFLIKKRKRKFTVPIKYYGFEIDNYFVVGYGLDYNEKFRNLPYIAILEDKEIE